MLFSNLISLLNSTFLPNSTRFPRNTCHVFDMPLWEAYSSTTLSCRQWGLHLWAVIDGTNLSTANLHKIFICFFVFPYQLSSNEANPLTSPLVPNPRKIMIFTMWVCYLKVGTDPKKFFKNSLFTDFLHVSYMIHWASVKFLILQFTPIPLVYLQIEMNDKIPHVNVHRVKYE